MQDPRLGGWLQQAAIPCLANLSGHLALLVVALRPRTSLRLWLGPNRSDLSAQQRSPRPAVQVASPNYVSHSARGSRGRQGTGLGLARSLLGVVVRSTRAGVPRGSVPAFCLSAGVRGCGEWGRWLGQYTQTRQGPAFRPPPPTPTPSRPWAGLTSLEPPQRGQLRGERSAARKKRSSWTGERGAEVRRGSGWGNRWGGEWQRVCREEQGPVCRKAGPGVREGPAPGDAGGTIGRCASGPAGRASEDGDGKCSLSAGWKKEQIPLSREIGKEKVNSGVRGK